MIGPIAISDGGPVTTEIQIRMTLQCACAQTRRSQWLTELARLSQGMLSMPEANQGL